MTATVATYAELAARILARPSSGARLVAVDGRGGAGKSVFAERLALALGGAPVVPTDDFATGEPGVEWWPRLEREVAMPLAHGQPARYRRYDWPSRTLAEWREIPVAPAVVIEGVSSARRAAAPLLAFSVWVHAPRFVRLARGLERDGPEALPDWERWIAEEDAHFAADGTATRCDLLVDGAPDVAHDPEREFVGLDVSDRAAL